MATASAWCVSVCEVLSGFHVVQYVSDFLRAVRHVPWSEEGRAETTRIGALSCPHSRVNVFVFVGPLVVQVFSCMGANYSAKTTLEMLAPNVADMFVSQRVDAALIVPM